MHLGKPLPLPLPPLLSLYVDPRTDRSRFDPSFNLGSRPANRLRPNPNGLGEFAILDQPINCGLGKATPRLHLSSVQQDVRQLMGCLL